MTILELKQYLEKKRPQFKFKLDKDNTISCERDGYVVLLGIYVSDSISESEYRQYSLMLLDKEWGKHENRGN